MPRPPTTIATRGRIRLARYGLHRAGEDRRTAERRRLLFSAAARGARSRRRARRAARDLPVARAGNDNVLALAAGAVDDGDGLAAGRRHWRGGGRGIAVAYPRPIVSAGMLGRAHAGRGRRPRVLRRWRIVGNRSAATITTGSPPKGLSTSMAEPTKARANKPRPPATSGETGTENVGRRFVAFSRPSGVSRSSVATAKSSRIVRVD